MKDKDIVLLKMKYEHIDKDIELTNAQTALEIARLKNNTNTIKKATIKL